MNNVIAYSLQVLLVIAGGALLPWLFRIHLPKARLWFWQGLLAVCLLLPFVQPRRVADINFTIDEGPMQAGTRVAMTPAKRLPVAETLLGVYAAGVALRGMWLLLGLLRLRRYRQNATPLHPPHSGSCSRAGTTRNVSRYSHIERHHQPCDVRPLESRRAFAAQLSGFGRRLAGGHRSARADARPARGLGLQHLGRDRPLDSLVSPSHLVAAGADPINSRTGGRSRHSGIHIQPRAVSGSAACRRQNEGSTGSGACPIVSQEAASRQTSGRHHEGDPHVETSDDFISRNCLHSCNGHGRGRSVCIPAGILAQESSGYQSPGISVDTAGHKLLHGSRVDYPQSAREKRIEGTVVLQLSLNAQGQVSDARVISGPDELRSAALSSACSGTWRTNPASLQHPGVDHL